MALTSVTSSELRRHSAALTFCSTCSGFVAPAITLGTKGWLASQPIATSSTPRPRAWANASMRPSISKFSGVSTRSAMPPAPASRVPSGGGSPARYLPERKPLASGEVWEHAEAVLLRDLHKIALDPSFEQAVLVL